MRGLVVLLLVALAAGGAWGELVQGVKCEKPGYGLGEKVAINYSIHNDGSAPLVYNFPTAKQFDVWVTRGDDVELFRLSKNKVYAQVLTSICLAPGETKAFSAPNGTRRTPRANRSGREHIRSARS